MNFAILRFLENKGSAYFMKILKTSYHNNSPPITAPANKGQDLQVPLRPLYRGYILYLNALGKMRKTKSVSEKDSLMRKRILV